MANVIFENSNFNKTHLFTQNVIIEILNILGFSPNKEELNFLILIHRYVLLCIFFLIRSTMGLKILI